jgi:hypothetical protein
MLRSRLPPHCASFQVASSAHAAAAASAATTTDAPQPLNESLNDAAARIAATLAREYDFKRGGLLSPSLRTDSILEIMRAIDDAMRKFGGKEKYLVPQFDVDHDPDAAVIACQSGPESQTIPLLSDALPWGMRCRDGELEQVAELFEKQQSGRGVDGKLPVISVIAPMRHGKGAFFDVVANSRRFARALSPTDEAASQARCFITEFGLFFPSDKWQIYSVDSAFRELWFRILASAAHDVCRSNRKDDLLDRMMREVPNLNANAFNEILNYFFGRASPRIFIFHEIAIIHSSFRL